MAYLLNSWSEWKQMTKSGDQCICQTHTHTHTRLTALFLTLRGWASTRKVKSIKQETVSGSGISWAACKSAPCSRQTTTPAPNHSVFYRPDTLPSAQPTASKHWRQLIVKLSEFCIPRQDFSSQAARSDVPFGFSVWFAGDETDVWSQTCTVTIQQQVSVITHAGTK